jgi:hypothetical protein
MNESYSLTFEGGLTKSHDKESTRGKEDRMGESLHIESCKRSRLASPTDPYHFSGSNACRPALFF